MELTLNSLYSRALSVEQEILMLQDDLKEIKTEYLYCKDTNTKGFQKEDVNKVLKAAKASAKQDDLATKIDELNEVIEAQEQYSK